MVIRGVNVGRPYRFSPFFDRTNNPASGYQGGKNGAPGIYELSDGRRPNPKATVWVDPDTDIIMGLPGGGGYGDPLDRDPRAVRDDVLDELVSPERAREDYGVVLTPDLEIDWEATDRLRAERRAG